MMQESALVESTGLYSFEVLKVTRMSNTVQPSANFSRKPKQMITKSKARFQYIKINSKGEIKQK